MLVFSAEFTFETGSIFGAKFCWLNMAQIFPVIYFLLFYVKLKLKVTTVVAEVSYAVQIITLPMACI